MKSTKIARSQSTAIDQSRPRLYQLVKSDPKFTKINEVDQNSENIVNQSSPKLIKIART